MMPRRSPCGDHSCSFPHCLSDCDQREYKFYNSLERHTRVKLCVTMRYSGARQIFYQTNVLVSAQHGCCHKVATGNPREPHDFVRLVWLQQEDVPLEIKKSLYSTYPVLFYTKNIIDSGSNRICRHQKCFIVERVLHAGDSAL